jgi:hypothetical protein
MKRHVARLSGLLIVALIVFGCSSYHPRHGWVTLIDGDKGMENWSVAGSSANWRAADGAIQADGAAPKGGASGRV